MLKNGNHNHQTFVNQHPEERKPMFTFVRVVGVVVAPLVLGACGLPVGVQIASLVADGISYLTTEKTLTDHGISVVTSKDCSLLRGVKGKNICRDENQMGNEDIELAEAPTAPLNKTAKGATSSSEQQPYPVVAEKEDLTEKKRRIIAPAPKPDLRSDDGAGKPIDTDHLILGQVEGKSKKVPVPAPVIQKATAAPIEPVTTETKNDAIALLAPLKSSKAELIISKNLVPAPPALAPASKVSAFRSKPASTQTIIPANMMVKEGAVKKRLRRTYYIIASYHRSADARRFSGRHSGLKPLVLEGTAKGHKVFRVAVGPIAKTERRTTRQRLKSAGFKDTWKLTLRAPKVVTELASLN